MDFGLRGRTAIVCAASMGLGKSCALALGGEGVKHVIVARRRDILETAACDIETATEHPDRRRRLSRHILSHFDDLHFRSDADKGYEKRTLREAADFGRTKL